MIDPDTRHAGLYGFGGFLWAALQSENLWTAVVTSVVCFLAVRLVGGLWSLVASAFRKKPDGCPHDDPGKS